MMYDFYYEISLDHMMDDDYIAHAKENASFSLGREVAKMLEDEKHHLLKLTVEPPPPYWREVYGNNPFETRGHFKYRYKLEVGIVQYRHIEMPVDIPDMSLPISHNARTITNTNTSLLANEIMRRIRKFPLFDKTNLGHRSSVTRFNSWMNFDE